jgi:hypothetical protein
MRYRVTSRFEGYVTSAYLFLEGFPIHMSYDGKKTYRSTDYLEIDDDALDVVLRVYGLNGTAWTLAVTVTRDGVPSFKKELTHTGEILKKQTGLLTTYISLSEQTGGSI